jgi:hypothetical protein
MEEDDNDDDDEISAWIGRRMGEWAVVWIDRQTCR